uniref:Cytochrome b n=1 Tax=Rhynchopus euleeides TaxID=630703 RepID=A0A2D2AJX3_9EUGL|nr:apocytochrome b [Rhynchopus euleeides]
MYMCYSRDMSLQLLHTVCMYSTTSSITIAYNAGALAGVCYAVQVLSGILMAFTYVSAEEYAYLVLDYANRDGTYVWCIRTTHSNTASVVFMAMYLHVLRAWLYEVSAVVASLLYSIGVIVWLLMMGTAFLGYVLPWGLMSFWALTVITNLLTVIPLVGDDVLVHCWGGYYISSNTLQRVLALHYLLPFVVLVLVLGHLLVLHVQGSGTPSLVPGTHTDGEPFIMYYYKDLWVLGISVLMVILIVLCYPDTLHHPDNYCYVDRYTTPQHIVPEWYFLPFYSMLRACSSKGIGVLILVASVLVYLLLLSVCTEIHTSAGIHAVVDGTAHVVILVVLGMLGQCSPSYPYVECSGYLTTICLAVHVLF